MWVLMCTSLKKQYSNDTTIFTATAPIALDMIACVLVAGALLPVHESACAKNQSYSVHELACTASPSCFQYDWDETCDVGSQFKNGLSNATCVGCVQPRGLVAKKGCERFTSLAARLCCASALGSLCCLPIGFALWVPPLPPDSSAPA